MTFLKSLWADLIEKRLWPIALVLLLALVAVPVYLGSGRAEPVDAAALDGSGATGAIGAQAQVSLDEPGAVRLDRDGKLRDPFKQRAARGGATGATGPSSVAAGTTPQPSATAAPGASGGGSGPGSAGGGTGSGGGSGSDGGPGFSGGGSGSDGGTSPSKPPELSTYVTELRFGRAGRPRPRRTVARLTPLPTVEQPFFVYLGVLTDRRTAVFLLSSDVRATGEGTCKPDKAICETIELRRGDTETLKVTGDDGKTTTYKLTVLDVRRKGTAATDGPTSQAKVTPKRTTPARGGSSDGEDLGTDRYRYDDDTGLLRRISRGARVDGRRHLPSRRDASLVERSRVGGGRSSARLPEGLRAMPGFSP